MQRRVGSHHNSQRVVGRFRPGHRHNGDVTAQPASGVIDPIILEHEQAVEEPIAPRHLNPGLNLLERCVLMLRQFELPRLQS
ncbi:hypothetical protein D3C83_15740 [compost metagenome]